MMEMGALFVLVPWGPGVLLSVLLSGSREGPRMAKQERDWREAWQGHECRGSSFDLEKRFSHALVVPRSEESENL